MILLLAQALAAALLPQQSPVAGRYELYRINGKPLPQLNDHISIRSGSLTLGLDDRFEATVVLYVVEPGRRTIDTLHASGTWAMRGDTAVVLTYRWRRTAADYAEDRVAVPLNSRGSLVLPRLGFINWHWLGQRTGVTPRLRFRKIA